MSLAIGSRLGPYEILGPLGAGGMGEVYKARDPRLDRVVAIKVLPPEHIADPSRQQRFDREARAVAALSHPNICAVFDVGQDTGRGYLVMEYLDGETLADRLATAGRRASASRVVQPESDSGGTSVATRAGRSLPIAETLGIAVQLANALAAAHNAGIVHRDLKPSNIVLLRSGSREGVPQVKVLDFGLARIAPRAPESQETVALLTGVGMLVGTVPYMSPEQVEGRDTDARSDIFSLGSVIYEMATGRRAFDAGSQAGVIAAILERQPEPITQIEPMTPAGLDRVVRTCLAKAPEDRWQHASDIARQLSWLAAESDSGTARVSSGVIPAASRDRSSAGRIGWPHIVAALASLLLAGDIVWRLVGGSTAGAAASATPAHFVLSVPGVTIDNVRVSPDGRTLAISGTREDGRSGIWVQKLAEGRAEQIPNLDADARLLDWSLDGSELAFRSPRGVVAVRTDGWLVRPLMPVGIPSMRTWGEGVILAGDDVGLRTFALGTGTPHDLTKGMALRPRFLPDGRRFMYTSRADISRQGLPDGLYLSSVDAPEKRRLILAKRSSGVYADGHLLFVEDSTMFAQPFDLSKAETAGTAKPVLDGVQYFSPNGAALFDAGAATIVYGTPPPDDSPVWVDRQGAITGKLGAGGLYTEPRVSPDGTRALYNRMDRRRSTGDLWVQDLSRHTSIQLTNDQPSEAALLWSPDGKSIAYGSDRDGPPDVYVQDIDAGTPPRKFFATDGVDYPISWLPGGRILIRTQTEYVIVRPDGTIESTINNLSLRSRGNVSASPDGRWVAAISLEQGETALYVQPLARTGVRVRVWAGSATQPTWSRDGRYLYFVAKRRLMQAAVRTGDTFSSDPPVELFALDRDIPDFDVSPDGQRFLIRRSPPPDYLPYHVLVNWRATLR